MISTIRTVAKRLSTWVQKSDDSFIRHNREYEVEGKIESERKISQEYSNRNQINDPILRALDLLEKNPVNTVVDIGSGTGWASAALSKNVDYIIGIEPSEAAIDIAKKLYPASEYPNITWIQGYAEEILATQKLEAPTMFITSCVLSHLRDKEVAKICTTIDGIAPVGSVLAFSECWADISKHQIMWHIRSKDWWQNALPNWTLDFHGPLHQNGDCHMGFWGVKNK